MRILYCTDIHGSNDRYKKIIDIHEQFDLTIIGGDILPKHFTKDERLNIISFAILNSEYKFEKRNDYNNLDYEIAMIKKQRKFISSFPRYFDLFKTPLIIDFANDDIYCNYKYFLKIISEYDNVYNIHLNESTINGISFMGMNFVPDYPFRLKDWCRKDTKDYIMNEIQYDNPFVSRMTNGIKQITDLKKYYNSKPSIKKVLKNLPKSSSDNCIYLFHSPPRDIGLDIVKRKSKDINVGSYAITDWIKENNPKLVLSGHIHESPENSGKHYNYLGDTLCIQPGQSNKDEELVYCSFELNNGEIDEKTISVKTI